MPYRSVIWLIALLYVVKAQEATVSRQDATGSRKDATGSRQDATGSRQDATGSRQDATGSRQDETGSRQDETGSRQDETGSRQDIALPLSPTKALCPSFHCNHSSTANNFELSRSKRGIGSLIMLLTSLGVQTGSIAVSLAGAISEGCDYFPSICKNLELIESYEKEAEKEKSELKELYVQYSKGYVQLREVMTNNHIIIYHTNSTINSLKTIGDLENETQAELQSKLPFVSEAASNWEDNKSIDFILQGLDSVEFDLEKIKEMLQRHQKNVLIGITAWTVIGVAIDRFSSSLDNAYKQVLDGLAPVDTNNNERSKTNQNMVQIQKKLKKTELFRKVTKQMGINLMDSVRNTWKISKKIGSIPMKSIRASQRFFTEIRTEYAKRGMRGALQFTTRKLVTQPVTTTISEFQTITNKIKKSIKNLPDTVKSYKMERASKVASVIGIVGDISQTVYSVIEWKQKADTVETSKQQHLKYLEDLRNKKILFEECKNNLSNAFQNSLEDFKNISKSLKSLISLLMESNDFLGVMGLMKPPVKKAHQILGVDFENVTKESVIGMQTGITGFLYENGNNLTKIENELRARKVSYNKIRKDSEEGKKIKDITSDLKEFYTYMTHEEERQFGTNLTMEDVVCTLAIIRKDKVEYDGFQLQPFRPSCEVNDTAFANIEKAAHQQRRINIMDDVIQMELTDANIDLSKLRNRISNELSEADSKNTSSVVTDAEILCRISKLYPNKTEYDFIPLQIFRPICDDVDEKRMTTLKSKAAKMRIIAESLQPLFTVCKNFKFCPCIPDIRRTLPPGTTDEDIKTAIKRLNPGETEYCGTTNCNCVQL